MKLYKFAVRLPDGRVVSQYDMATEWRVGEENRVAAPSVACVGLNACERIIDAREYVAGDVLLLVEASGKYVKDNDKYTHERQRVLKMWDASGYDKVHDAALAEYEKACAAAWAEYEKACAAAWAEYEKVRDAALEEYEKVRDAALEEYRKVRAAAWAEYKKVCDAAWAEYEKVRAAAWAEYDKACSAAWAEYKKVRRAARAEYERAVERNICTKEREL